MHLSKLPSGRWRVAVKHRGQRATATATTKAAARVAGAQLLLNLGARQRPDVTPVGDLLDGHLDRVNWSPTTTVDAHRITRQLPAVFLQRAVSDVDPAVLAGLYRQLAADGWSSHKIRRAHMVISTAWAEAIMLGWASINPARFVKLPKATPRDIHPPDTEQVVAVLEQAGPTFAVFLRLAADIGARRGELGALQWEDVDFDQGYVLIARSLVQTPGQRPTIRDTKTSRKGHRVVSMALPTTTALRRLRTAQVERAMSAGLPDPVWIFSHDAGITPWRPDHPSRLFRHAARAAGVTGVRLHDLRHYVATSMLYDGESPHDVAGQLGHASTATTLSVYAHFVRGRGRESAEKRAARLQRPG
jgi:integrase